MWGDMKPILKSRVGDEEESLDYFPNSPRKDWSIGLVQLVKVLVIFMAGVLIGLSISANFTHYYNSQTDLFFPSTMYTSNCDKDCTSFKNFIKPSHLMHTMKDEELFWRASLVPKMEEFPFNKIPKVAFLFMTRGPLPFAPLWEKFFKGHEQLYSIYVHTLPDYKLNVSKESPFYGRQIPSEEVSWGSITLVDAEKRLLANALLDFSNERFILLSESCIPIYNFPTIYEYLINSVQSYVESYYIETPQCEGRYNKRMSPLITLNQWRKGSEWFELSRELAINVLADYKYYSLFRKYCRPSCYPDEHYIPTFLNKFYRSLNSNRSITWVDWSRGGPHPARYGGENITVEFINKIRNNGTRCSYNGRETGVCYLFARKFAPSALAPLMNMTSMLFEL